MTRRLFAISFDRLGESSLRCVVASIGLAALGIAAGGMTCAPVDQVPQTPADVAGPNAFVEITDNLGDAARIVGWGGIAVFDDDNDGDIDILQLNGAGTPNRLFQNDGAASFTEAGAAAGVALTDDNCTTAGVGDFNNDGRLDLLVGRQRIDVPSGADVGPVLLLNDGPNSEGVVTFSVADPAFTGLSSTSPAMAFGVGDLDNDGLLDIIVGRYDLAESGALLAPIYDSQPNELWHCTGGAGGIPTYERIDNPGIEGTTQHGWSPETENEMFIPGTLVLHLSDVDGDGLLDVFDCHDIPGGIDYFHNDGNLSFTRRQDDILNKHGGWMGMTSGDVDRDGDIDYFITNVGCDFTMTLVPNTVASAHNAPNGAFFHKFLRNDGGTLVDVTATTPVDPTGPLPPVNANGGTNLEGFEFGFGTTFIDADNRGRLDLYWVGDLMSLLGPNLSLHSSGVGRFLHNNGDGSFKDDTAARGLFDIPPGRTLAAGQHEAGRALAACDLNGDGAQDVVIANGSMLGGRQPGLRILLNPARDVGHWLTVRLNGSASNRFGIGAKVVAEVGGTPLVREVLSTTSSFMGAHPEAHFGLDSATTVSTLTVIWPSGATTVLNDVAADQVLTVEE